MRAALLVLSGALAVLALWTFKPWYHRALTWSILRLPGSQDTRFDKALLAHVPIGSSPEQAKRVLAANGFDCHDVQHKGQPLLSCHRSFGLLLFTTEWRVILHMDGNGAIERVWGRKFFHAP